MSKKNLKLADIVHRHASKAKHGMHIKHAKHAKQLSNFMSKTVLIFISLGIVVFLAVLFISLSSISLYLQPDQEIISLDLDIILDKYAEEINFDKNLIPSHLFTAVYEQVKRFPATKKEYLEQRAQGMVTVFNDYSTGKQTLIPNTRFVSSDGLLFRALEKIIIPGKKGSEPGSVDVMIIADQAGAEFNIGPSEFQLPAFQEMQSPRYKKIWAESYESMKGGSSSQVLIVSDQDILQAKEIIKAELEQKAMEKLEQETAKSQNFTINKKAVFEKDFYLNPSAEPGVMADAFNISGFIELETLAYDKNDLYDLIQNAINQVINPEIQEIFEIKDEYIFLQEIVPSLDKGQIKLQIHVEQPVHSKINTEKIKNDLSGKDIEQIKEYLESLSGIEHAQIEIWPSFAKYLPNFIRRVKINLD